MFDLRTTKRVYYLVAGSEEDMNRWVECICAVCGLKMESVVGQSEMALLPPIYLAAINASVCVDDHIGNERYSPQPGQNEQPQPQLPPPLPPPTSTTTTTTVESSSSSSPMSTSTTLNYIPISECYTGKVPPVPPVTRNSPPPPRPPKPSSLGGGQKSQSSLALWQVESPESQPKLPTNPPPPKLAPSTMLVADNQTALSPNHQPQRSFYLNSKLPSTNQQVQAHYQQPAVAPGLYDTWHSGSFAGKYHHQDQHTPPQVNRSLKPTRRHHFSGSVPKPPRVTVTRYEDIDRSLRC